MSRTTIKRTGEQSVAITIPKESPMGEILYLDHDLDREFYVPQTSSGSGYVRERPNQKQVCGALLSHGDTLRCSPEQLLDTIRREYQAFCRYHKR